MRPAAAAAAAAATGAAIITVIPLPPPPPPVSPTPPPSYLRFRYAAHALLFDARNGCATLIFAHNTACDMTGALRCALPPLLHPPRQGCRSYHAAVDALAAMAKNRHRASELSIKTKAPAGSLPLPLPSPFTLSPRRCCRCLDITAAMVTLLRSAQ